MNSLESNEYNYINYLITTQEPHRCTEVQPVQLELADAAANDAITRLLHPMEP